MKVGNCEAYFIFMCPCIISMILFITANKMQLFLIYLFLKSLHVSGGSSAHHQEHLLYTQLQVLSTNNAAGWYRV